MLKRACVDASTLGDVATDWMMHGGHLMWQWTSPLDSVAIVADDGDDGDGNGDVDDVSDAVDGQD